VTPGSPTDYPSCHLVASKDATSIAVALANRSGGAASLVGLEAVATVGRELVSSLTVTSSGFTLVPVGGKPGQVHIVVTTPFSSGRKTIGIRIVSIERAAEPPALRHHRRRLARVWG
jgi:hypothetical protein